MSKAAGVAGRAVRLTGRGFGLLVVVAAAASLAVVVGYRELTLLAAAGASALTVACLAVARPIPLAAEVSLDQQYVPRGDAVRMSVTVSNPTSRRSPPVVLGVADTGAVSDTGASHAGTAGSFGVPALAPSAVASFELALDTTTRGVVAVGPVALRRTDRFGLLARSAQAGNVTHLHVWPRPRDVAPLASPRSRDAGGHAFDGASGGVIFSSLREYAPGDDLRRVHWPSSARRGELLVREYAEPSEPTSTVLLDTRPAGYPPGPAGDVGFDEAVDVAASVVLASTRLRTPVRLVTTGGLSVVGRRRRSDEATFLDALAVVSREADATLDVVATSRRGGVGTLTVVTGVVDAGQLEAVAPVVHRFEQVVVLRVGIGAPPLSGPRSQPRRAATEPSTSRLRVVAVRTAADLLNQWPSRSSSARAVLSSRAAGQ